MKLIPYYITDVFTSRAFGGNPLAVFLDGDELNSSQMQQIAKEMNLSETVFVCKPKSEKAWALLRIFTTEEEIPFAGHPNIGTAAVLISAKKFPPGSVENQTQFKGFFEEGVGHVALEVEQVNGELYSELQTAVPATLKQGLYTKETYASLLGLEVEDFRVDIPIHISSAGLDFGIVVLKNLESLQKVVINNTVWETHFKDTPAKFTYAVVINESTNEVNARMFCPSIGVPEDPATGSAAAALSGLLAKYFPSSGNINQQKDGFVHWSITQGVEIGRPSHIELSYKPEQEIASIIRVKGQSVIMARGHFML